jgi:hypothetical protein
LLIAVYAKHVAGRKNSVYRIFVTVNKLVDKRITVRYTRDVNGDVFNKITQRKLCAELETDRVLLRLSGVFCYDILDLLFPYNIYVS